MEFETAYAKINLALHVRRRRADGYHDLETVFAFAEDGDGLRGDLADALSLTVAGPFGDGLDGEDNLVLRAAHAMADACGVMRGAALHLDKRLPVASGIGGGSADAAAALRLLARLWDIDVADERVAEIAARLGADVPACLQSMPIRGTGRGDSLSPVPGWTLDGKPMLLANPGIPLSTSAVFARWDGVDRGPLDGLREGRNDLTEAAIAVVPEIAALLELLEDQSDSGLVRMSGSGATCFALFETIDARDAAEAAVRAAMPQCWTRGTRLR